MAPTTAEPEPSYPVNRHSYAFPTRSSLIERLKDPADQESWREFADTYRRLIFSVALRSGLSEAEAQEVVQETLVSVARKMPEFTRVHRAGTFKSWLLTLTRWRIIDQVRKRPNPQAGSPAPPAAAPVVQSDQTSRTATIEKVADPQGVELEAIWDAEWEQHLLGAAMERLRGIVDPELLQLFDCHVLRGWPASTVAERIGVSLARVYFAKYKVSKLLRREVKILQEALS